MKASTLSNSKKGLGQATVWPLPWLEEEGMKERKLCFSLWAKPIHMFTFTNAQCSTALLLS